MNAYRNAPITAPLLVSAGGYLLALDATTGAMLWSHKMERPMGRVVVVGGTVFASTRGSNAPGDTSFILMLDLETGQQKGGFDSGFGITTVLAHEGRIYFSGHDRTLALSGEGRVLFHVNVRVTKHDMWNGDEREMFCVSADGPELWRIPKCGYSQTPFLVMGEVAVQADYEG